MTQYQRLGRCCLLLPFQKHPHVGNPGCLLFIFTRANWLVHGLGKEQNWAIASNIRTPPPPG